MRPENCFHLCRIVATDELKLFLETESTVYSIDKDLLIVGNLLFCDRSSLKTTNGTQTTLIAGSASQSGLSDGIGEAIRFSPILEFVQLMDSPLVIIADGENYCLRQLNRLTLQISPFSGSCGYAGYQSGTFSLFNMIYDVIHDIKNSTQLIVTDLPNRALRGVNIHTGQTRTLFKHVSFRFIQLTQDMASGDIYVTFNHGVARYDYSRKTFTLIAESSNGFGGMFVSNPWAMLILNMTTLLVAEPTKSRIKILNFGAFTSSSICSRNFGSSEYGNFTSCQMSSPFALVRVDDTLYVGGFQHIYAITGE